MKLISKLLIISLGCSALYVNAEQLSQEKYNFLLNQYMQTIQNTKPILDDENSSATSEEQFKALCERINAYRQIKKISLDNIILEQASTVLVAANFYLDRQQKSLNLSSLEDSTFCKVK